MRDVANSANVSLKTVSRVVNGESGVRPELVMRVESAIDELGFRRNEIASSLRRGRAGAVGLVIEDLANPFYSAIAHAVEQYAHDRGHALLIGSCEEDPARERALVLRMLRSIDALLIVPAGDDHRYLMPEQQAGTPMVFIDRPPRGIDADSVLADNAGGARRGVAHLIAHGHRRIGFVGESAERYTAAQRLAGYHEALTDAGIGFDPALVGVSAGDPEGAARALLAGDARPTALFCADNRHTVGALRAVRTSAEPVALLGFDDFELAELLPVPVSVVRFDVNALGAAAARLAYGRVDGGRGVPAREVVPCELVARGSGELAPA
ncbi:MAG: LacI family DNA-binding transcriptional regulator [Solirubrobacteraceae bacterium]